MLDPNQTFLNIQAMAIRYGVSTRTIAKWWRAGQIAQPARLGGRLLRWRLADVLAHENSQYSAAPHDDAEILSQGDSK